MKNVYNTLDSKGRMSQLTQTDELKKKQQENMYYLLN